MPKRVAIIGAGMSGLLACKYIASRGFNPIVFESENQVGGLWNHTVESTRLQSTTDIFKFSDFPWPASVQDVSPRAADLLGYINSYAAHFNLLPYIHFNSRVLSIDYVGESQEEMESWELWGGKGKAFGSKGKWQIKVLDTKENSSKDYEVEFVVLCIGRFSGLPNIPEFPVGSGPEVFSGKVLHSMNYSSMDNASAAEFIRGKHVVIIGSGKSAIDIANECAIANGKDCPCTMIYRSSHWTIPDMHPWGVDLGLLLFNRLSEMLVHKPGEGHWDSALATMMSPMRWGISKFIESYLRWKLSLKKYNMIPEESFVQECSSCTICFLPNKFYDKVEDGSIVLKKSEKYSFCKEGLILDGEDKPLNADIIIFATGYKGDQKLKNIFADATFGNVIIGSPISAIPLFRQMIHPRIPQLAIIGYAESFCNLHTFEMKSKWLASFLDEDFGLPSIKEMEDDIDDWGKFMKRYSSNNQYRRACIGTIHICYNDQLLKDMGCNPRRKKGFIRDLLEPYSTADYEGLEIKI